MHKQGTLFDRHNQDLPVKDDLILCRKCGSAMVRSPGTPPHHARVDCMNPSCKTWRWLPKPQPRKEVG